MCNHLLEGVPLFKVYLLKVYNILEDSQQEYVYLPIVEVSCNGHVPDQPRVVHQVSKVPEKQE